MSKDKSYFRTHGAAITGGVDEMKMRADAVLQEAYDGRATTEIEAFLSALFKSSDVQRMMRDACKSAIADAVKAVLEGKRPELEADVSLFIEEHWAADLENVAKAALADELARLRRKLTGGA